MSANLVPSQNPEFVLGAWPMMEWLKNKQPAADRVLALFEQAKGFDCRLSMSTINLGEVFYGSWKEWGEHSAGNALATVQGLPIEFVHPTEMDVLHASSYKGRFNISYADAFGARLAIKKAAPFVTGDADFLTLQMAGLLRLHWIGA